LYLNVDRIRHRFTGYLGAIRDFSRSLERSAGGNPKVKAIFVEAGLEGSAASGPDISWDMANPLAQALVLRVFLAVNGELANDVHGARSTAFVLARGPGLLSHPDSASLADGLPLDVAEDIKAEQERQMAIALDDHAAPRYWPSYARTESGLAVSLLGVGSMFGTDVRSWIDADMTYCMFGQKIKDRPGWTLLQPLHVWLEPPSVPAWG
jgi:hypothetical protein